MKIEKIKEIMDEVEKVILGKREVIQLTVTALLSGGHVLLEDVPGVGKTVLVKTLAKVIDGDFSRVQFTPDLLPSDILGVSIFNMQSNTFEFRKGPIFTTVLLADEINRTTPRTQAALLEAMSEGKVTVDNHTYSLSNNFFVLATQNPIEYEGTYPLPEAQLDRFLFRLNIGYPGEVDELQLMLNKPVTDIPINQIVNEEEIIALKEMVDEVYIDDIVGKYALELVKASRNHKNISLGVSPRGSIAFVRSAKAYALTEGRTYVTPQDLQKLLPYVFGHRILLRSSSSNLDSILDDIIESVPIPVVRG